jgi:ribose transport system substrate-binding protein
MKPKVVVSLLTKDQEFQTMQAADAERAAAAAGLDIEIIYAKNNATLQLEQLYRFVNAPQQSRPAAIIAQPVSGQALARVARDAAKAGIGWVLLSREAPYVDALRIEYPQLPIAIVTTDQLEVGRIQGRQFRALLPNGGNVLYIHGPSDTSAALQRTQGMEESIAGAKINVKAAFGEWTEASGEQAVISWLRFTTSQQYRVDLIGAQNDAMAVGARKASAARRPEWLTLPFTGCDGLPQGGRRLVDEGQLAATVILQSNAGPAIDLVAAHLRTGTRASGRITLAPYPYPSELKP